MMEEKDVLSLQNEAGNSTEGNAQYLAAIKELKEKSVSRDDYLKLKEENKNLLATIVDGGQMIGPVTPTKPVKEEISELREDLFDKDNELSNLDYVTKTLALRDTLISDGQRDPFLPVGNFVVVEQSDVDKANKVAEILKECVDYADGNSVIFTDELNRRLVEVKPSGKRK